MKQNILLLFFLFAGLKNYSQTELWGVTTAGGPFNGGSIFKTDSIGNSYTVEHNFIQVEGWFPTKAGLVETANGKFYGITTTGGNFGLGVIFEYDTLTGVSKRKFDFGGQMSGREVTGLMCASDGKLYGLAMNGGLYGFGTLFQYDPIANLLTKKIDFDGALKGKNPDGTLLQASDGKLYGMTQYGGTNGSGVIFQYDPVTNIFNKKIDFNSSTGSVPSGYLVETINGKLYGTTAYGGVNTDGTLFQYDINTSTITKKFDFDNLISGESPGSLIQAPNGKLYGTTKRGGIYWDGTIFEYDALADSFAKKFDFDETVHGRYPVGLTLASDGSLYGVTDDGGGNSLGVLFQFNITTSTYTKKLDFSGTNNGSIPNSSLIEASNGSLYGMTRLGGESNVGVIFEYNFSTSALTKKIDFGAKNGNVAGELMYASDGMIYGVCSFGGKYNRGVLFQYDPGQNMYTKKIVFNDTLGAMPHNSLIEATDGKLYGRTTGGGAHNNGVIFQYDPATSTYTKKFDFVDSISGSGFGGALIQAADGKIYGISSQGGATNNGVLFQFDPVSNVYIKKYDFLGSTAGGFPFGSLVETADGKLYGITYQGGSNNGGVLFQYDPLLNIYAKKFDFVNVTGDAPISSLVIATDSMLYGTTSMGGANNRGVLFQYDPLTNVYSKKIDFDGAGKGSSPQGSFFQSSNGKIYGLASSGGINGFGTLFQFDIITNGFIKRLDFDSINGSIPLSLIEISKSISTGTVNLINCAGASITVPYSVAGFFSSGNVFTAELSDASGSFALPINIGSVTAVGSGTLHANLPALISAGTGYRVRIVSSNPAIVGYDNGSNIIINSCTDVWPGDANSDGTADNLDVLELGLHYTQTGAPRANTSNNWQSYFATNWTGTITNGKNLNHSDCNGDGTINDDDTLAIYNNYGLTHTFKPVQTTTVNPQLSIVPEQTVVVKGMWGSASVYLGDVSNPINNINGVAFTVDFDNSLIEQDSIYLIYQNSFMDAGQNLYFRKLDFTNAKLFTATTHTINNNVSGYGKIATLHYQIKSNLATDEVLTIGLSQANQSDAAGVISPLTTGAGTLMVIGTSVGVNESSMHNIILISPNPTSGLLNVIFSIIPQKTKIEVYNSIGSLVRAETLNNKISTINISDLRNGMYFMKVLEDDKVVLVKKVIKE